ncbi:MAG: four helix bundle protein [Sandaracinus sp.]
MLNIYAVALRVVRQLRPVIRQIAVHNRNLADHLDRSSVAVPLLIAEASGVRAGNRKARHLSALGEAEEVRAALDVAEATEWVSEVPREVRADLGQIIGTLVKLTRG